MKSVKQVDDHSGTVLWYEGIRHVTHTLGGQEGKGAVDMCKTMAQSITTAGHPVAFAQGVRAACLAVIQVDGVLAEPRKTVLKR